MIKLLPITRCNDCKLLSTTFRGRAKSTHTCASTKEKRDIENINDIPEWCPLDDAEEH